MENMGDVEQRDDPNQNQKLIYYPVGNIFQLFDLEKDPNELKDVSGDSAYTDCLNDLKQS